MSTIRTTILLDADSRRAAKALAAQLNVSPSEAIRRALVRYRDEVLGLPSDARRRRTAALERLFGLFEGHDAEAEVRRLRRPRRRAADIAIGVTAASRNALLLTRNARDFAGIDGLDLEGLADETAS